jgi:hypothetical protein
MASEEKLISSAKQVASSTAQLLVACKVKADPDAESTKRLQVCSAPHLCLTIFPFSEQIWSFSSRQQNPMSQKAVIFILVALKI